MDLPKISFIHLSRAGSNRNIVSAKVSFHPPLPYKNAHKKTSNLYVSLCCNVGEQEPILVMKVRTISDPLTYQKHLDETPEEKEVHKRERVDLATEAQVKQFINEVYCPSRLKNNGIYLKGTMSNRKFII